MSGRCVFFACHADRRDFFANGLLTAIESVRLTNPSLPIVVLHDGLTPGDAARLDGCQLIEVDDAPFDYGHRSDLTYATFFKFHIAKLTAFDQALYLDSDLVVLDSLDEVFDRGGVLAARRQDCGLSEDFRDPDLVSGREGLRDDSPFANGGVVCFDTAFWTKEGLLERAREVLTEYGAAFFLNADQGILNVLAHRYGGFTELPIAFNYCRWPDMVARSTISLATNRRGLLAPTIEAISDGNVADVQHGDPHDLATVVHWNGPDKPWELADARQRERYVSACYEQIRNRRSTR